MTKKKSRGRALEKRIVRKKAYRLDNGEMVFVWSPAYDTDTPANKTMENELSGELHEINKPLVTLISKRAVIPFKTAARVSIAYFHKLKEYKEHRPDLHLAFVGILNKNGKRMSETGATLGNVPSFCMLAPANVSIEALIEIKRRGSRIVLRTDQHIADNEGKIT